MKHLLSTLLLVFLPMIMFPQQRAQNDIIQTTDSRTIQALIVEIDLQVVRYRLAGSPDGPIHTIRKADIMTITQRDGNVVVFNTPRRMQLQNDLLQAQVLRANGLAWMYVGLGTSALALMLDLFVVATWGRWSEETAFIPTVLYVAGGGMVIGGGIAALTGMSRRDNARRALYSYTLLATPNTKLNLNLNPNSIGLALTF